MRKTTRAIIIIIISMILVFTAVEIYEFNFKNHYTLSVEFQSNSVKPGVGTNFTITMRETYLGKYDLNTGVPHAICIFYIGNNSFSDRWGNRSYYSRATELYRNMSCSYSTNYAPSTIGAKIPVTSFSGTGTKTLSLHWNGTVQETPINCNRNINTSYEPAIPGNYVVIPSLCFISPSPPCMSFLLSSEVIHVNGPEISYETAGNNVTISSFFHGKTDNRPVGVEFVNRFFNSNKNETAPFIYSYKNLTFNGDMKLEFQSINISLKKNYFDTYVYERWNNISWMWLEVGYAF